MHSNVFSCPEAILNYFRVIQVVTREYLSILLYSFWRNGGGGSACNLDHSSDHHKYLLTARRITLWVGCAAQNVVQAPMVSIDLVYSLLLHVMREEPYSICHDSIPGHPSYFRCRASGYCCGSCFMVHCLLPIFYPFASLHLLSTILSIWSTRWKPTDTCQFLPKD